MKRKQALKVMGMVLAGSLVLSEVAPVSARAASVASESTQEQETEEEQETSGTAIVCYIDMENGDDTADGSTPENAVKTLEQAKKLYQEQKESSDSLSGTDQEEKEPSDSSKEETSAETEKSGAEGYFVFCGMTEDELKEYLETAEKVLKEGETLIPSETEALTGDSYESILAEQQEEPTEMPAPGAVPSPDGSIGNIVPTPVVAPVPDESEEDGAAETGDGKEEEPVSDTDAETAPEDETAPDAAPGETPEGQPTITPAPSETPEAVPTGKPEVTPTKAPESGSTETPEEDQQETTPVPGDGQEASGDADDPGTETDTPVTDPEGENRPAEDTGKEEEDAGEADPEEGQAEKPSADADQEEGSGQDAPEEEKEPEEETENGQSGQGSWQQPEPEDPSETDTEEKPSQDGEDGQSTDAEQNQDADSNIHAEDPDSEEDSSETEVPGGNEGLLSGQLEKEEDTYTEDPLLGGILFDEKVTVTNSVLLLDLPEDSMDVRETAEPEENGTEGQKDDGETVAETDDKSEAGSEQTDEEQLLLAQAADSAPFASAMAAGAEDQGIMLLRAPGTMIVGPDNYDKKPSAPQQEDQTQQTGGSQNTGNQSQAASTPAATTKPETTKRPSSGQSTASTKTPQKKTDTVSSIKTYPVQTGDTAMILPLSISTVLSGLVLAMLSALHIQNRRREKDLAWQRFREENPLNDEK